MYASWPGATYVIGTLFGVLIFGTIQTLIMFQGSLSSWWTKIVIGLLTLVFCLFHVFRARAVVLATGGIGKAYQITSNSWEYTGDGHVLAYDAGAELMDMECCWGKRARAPSSSALRPRSGSKRTRPSPSR